MEYIVKVLKEDMENGKYSDILYCPIAKALRRLGFKATVGGASFVINNVNYPIPEYYADLIVAMMVHKNTPIEDFEFTINL